MSETAPQDNAAPTSAPPASGGGESGASTGATQIDMGRGRGGRGSK